MLPCLFSYSFVIGCIFVRILPKFRFTILSLFDHFMDCLSFIVSHILFLNMCRLGSWDEPMDDEFLSLTFTCPKWKSWFIYGISEVEDEASSALLADQSFFLLLRILMAAPMFFFISLLISLMHQLCIKDISILGRWGCGGDRGLPSTGQSHLYSTPKPDQQTGH